MTHLVPYRDLTVDEIEEKFNLVDEFGRRYYDDSNHIFRPSALGNRPNLCYSWRGFTNPNPSGWVMKKERLEEEFQKGNFVILPSGKLQRRKYIKDHKGKKLSNLWDDINSPSSKERTGYPTQKPLALLNRIINASSNQGDIVFDPFCGCATALVAAQGLNRQWIGIDVSSKAVDLVRYRLREMGELEPKLITPRTDIPKRTDLDIPVRYNAQVNITKLYGEQGGHCNACRSHFEKRNLEVDHIIARKQGGTDHIDNLQLLCGNCNRIKGDRGQPYLMDRLKALDIVRPPTSR